VYDRRVSVPLQVSLEEERARQAATAAAEGGPAAAEGGAAAAGGEAAAPAAAGGGGAAAGVADMDMDEDAVLQRALAMSMAVSAGRGCWVAGSSRCSWVRQARVVYGPAAAAQAWCAVVPTKLCWAQTWHEVFRRIQAVPGRKDASNARVPAPCWLCRLMSPQPLAPPRPPPAKQHHRGMQPWRMLTLMTTCRRPWPCPCR
jgi:hypothetical protein